MPTIDELLDYYNSYTQEIPQEIYDIADQVFNITDDEDVPQEYYLWISRQLMRLNKGSQL